jgi:putative ABC transport system substrate-binding protein
MKRREFIMLLGSAAVLVPLAARAQRPAAPTMGFLSARSPDESAHLLAAFRRGLAETGYVEGQNVTIEYRWANGEYDRLPALAAELAQLPVAVLVAVGGETAARAAKAASNAVPIVTLFGADPVESGLVASLNRPGGNVTGISNLSAVMEPKRIGLLREIVPQALTLGALLNPQSPTFASQLRDMQQAAQAVGLQFAALRANTDAELETAFESIAQHRVPVLLVAADAFFSSRRQELVALAARHGVPAMYAFRDFAVAGGLMSYGIDLTDSHRLVGIYAGRVLKGDKPAELPVMQATKFEFVINLKTARTLRLDVPLGLSAAADEVIE